LDEESYPWHDRWDEAERRWDMEDENVSGALSDALADANGQKTAQ
jgi:hypothetical protein